MTDQSKITAPLTRQRLDVAISAFARHGIDFRAPWECDLDDLERERFDALCEAIAAAMVCQGAPMIRESLIERLLTCGNHIATYRTDRWPDYQLDGLTRDQQCEHALRNLGATQEYDMWCCWSGMMQVRDEINDISPNKN